MRYSQDTGKPRLRGFRQVRVNSAASSAQILGANANRCGLLLSQGVGGNAASYTFDGSPATPTNGLPVGPTPVYLGEDEVMDVLTGPINVATGVADVVTVLEYFYLT